MTKNDLKLNMLFVVLAIFTTSCGVNNRSVQKSSPDNNNSSYLRNSIEDFAMKQVGVKYKYAGKTPKGFDCSGFTSYVFREFDVDLSPSSKLQAKQGKSVNLKWVKKGDLIFFGSGGKISHVALVVDNKNAGIYVIHSTSSRGVIVENVSKSTYWKKRIMFARNVLGS
jgi:cell wall-associated NlpC family hydrolase